MWQTVLNRLKEPSTHAAICALAPVIVLTFVPPDFQKLAFELFAVFGVTGVVLPERKS